MERMLELGLFWLLLLLLLLRWFFEVWIEVRSVDRRPIHAFEPPALRNEPSLWWSICQHTAHLRRAV